MFEKRPPAIDAGPAIDRMSFLASEIGSDVAGLRSVVDPFPFDAVLAGIENFFDQKETIGADALKYAKWAWVQIASNASRKEPQIVRERILQLLTRHDPLRIAVGIDAIFVMSFDDRRNLPDDVMLDLIVAPLNDDAASSLKQHLERHFAAGRAPPSEEIRERAKAYLSDSSLSSWKLILLQRLSEPK